MQDGIAEMITHVQVEATFSDGAKLVTIHNPIQLDTTMKPGEYLLSTEPIMCNAG